MRKRTPVLALLVRYMKVLMSDPKSKMRWYAVLVFTFTQAAMVTWLSLETMPLGRVMKALSPGSGARHCRPCPGQTRNPQASCRPSRWPRRRLSCSPTCQPRPSRWRSRRDSRPPGLGSGGLRGPCRPEAISYQGADRVRRYRALGSGPSAPRRPRIRLPGIDRGVGADVLLGIRDQGPRVFASLDGLGAVEPLVAFRIDDRIRGNGLGGIVLGDGAVRRFGLAGAWGRRARIAGEPGGLVPRRLHIHAAQACGCDGQGEQHCRLGPSKPLAAGRGVSSWQQYEQDNKAGRFVGTRTVTNAANLPGG